MFKSKLLYFVVTILFNSITTAQTIGDLQGVDPTAPTNVPPPPNSYTGSMPAQPTNDPNLIRAQNKNTSLTGIFISKDFAQAEFNVNGTPQYFGLGDNFKDGWRIGRIESQSVRLEKCGAGKKSGCTYKTIVFSGG